MGRERRCRTAGTHGRDRDLADGADYGQQAVDIVVDRTIAALNAQPGTISPNGDGVDDSTTFSFMLAGNVPVRLDLEQAGVVVATLFQGQLGIGPHTLDWDGRANGWRCPDGSYTR